MKNANFGPGPWQEEPDKFNWIDETTGLDCMIVRNIELGNLCGYVGVPLNSKLANIDYNDLDIDIHGGLTYSNKCQGLICHDSTKEVYWFGFDCAHYNDLIPKFLEYTTHNKSYFSLFNNSTYRDFNYVKTQVIYLAQQLKALL